MTPDRARFYAERDLWVPVIRFISCDLRILMDQPTESILVGQPFQPG
jgi:hypothetical protein